MNNVINIFFKSTYRNRLYMKKKNEFSDLIFNIKNNIKV